MELLNQATTVVVLCFVVASMLSIGASLKFNEITRPLRSARLVAVTLVANFVLMPLVAFTLARALWLDEAFGIGLVLLGCAAGAPFLPKLAELSKGDLGFAVGMMVILTVVSVGYLPLILPLLLPGAAVDAGKIALSLVVLMLLPLGVGLIIRARYPRFADLVKPVLVKISNIALVLLLLLIAVVNFDKVLQVFGTRAILAALLLVAAGLALGWLLGGPDAETKRVMALGTSSRNFAAALVVANQSFSDPKVAVMIIVGAIVGFAVLIPLSRALALRGMTSSA
jgi:BASS family bile acid:Na+ symporter